MVFNINSPEFRRKTRQMQAVVEAKRGDIRPLIALLRSDEPLTEYAREYMAAELENPPKQRFLRKIRENPDTEKKDRRVIEYLDVGKLAISDDSGGTIEPWQVSDTSAINWLAEHGIDWVNEATVNNARRRAKAKGIDRVEYANGKGQVSTEK